MGSVHHISGDEMLENTGTNAECIACLERTLEKARNGEVVGVVISAQCADGSTIGPSGGFIYNARIIGDLMIHVARLSNG